MTGRPKRLEQTTNSALPSLTSLISKEWTVSDEIDGTAEPPNPTLEHLEQLNDRRFQLSTTKTTTYVRFDLVCKQVVVCCRFARVKEVIKPIKLPRWFFPGAREMWTG
jgi:hypothetical protein